MSLKLPIHSIRSAFTTAIQEGDVVITAATGSGKSTEVPRWCPKPTVVIEPRRVACRALAHRVAELEGSKVGDAVGYIVRDEIRARPSTGIVFVTPGVALRRLSHYLSYRTFVVDEVHERTLDIDLLLALSRGNAQRLVVMSATIDADRIATTLGAQKLEAEGRTFPVHIEYDERSPTVPAPDHLATRVAAAVGKVDNEAGDILIFLPGKGEISQVRRTLRSSRPILELHGSMSPQDQSKVFQPGPPRIILSTNVAETSVTVPGVRTVIDSGLVRQVRYFQGRGTLTMLAIARDSADQRAGRAGRTAEGRCLRLWRAHAHLDTHTPPEIHRMSLVPLVLAARFYERDPEKLPWLDDPKGHAIDSATEELRALDALDADNRITHRGKALFDLPVDPWLGRILVEAEAHNLLEPAIDLVSTLSLGRSIYGQSILKEADDPREMGCDLTAYIAAIRGQGGSGVDQNALSEARSHRKRLRQVMGLKNERSSDSAKPIDRDELLRIILKADPRAARVARRRGRKLAWGGHGTELIIDRRSALELSRQNDSSLPWPDAIIVLSIRSQREGARSTLIATAVAGTTLRFLDRMGLGTPKIGHVQFKNGKIAVDVENVYAGRTLSSESCVPDGELLREAVMDLVKSNRLFSGVFGETENRLSSARLARRLVEADLVKAYPGDLDTFPMGEDARTFLTDRLSQLGLEEAEDLELVSENDLLPPPMPEHIQAALNRDYPIQVDLGEAKYQVKYDLAARRVVLLLTSGNRKNPPPRNYLPRFPGFKVSIQAGGTTLDLG